MRVLFTYRTRPTYGIDLTRRTGSSPTTTWACRKTDGRLLFFNLDELSRGDGIVLKYRSDSAYKYRVTDIFKVGPHDAWVADTLLAGTC